MKNWIMSQFQNDYKASHRRKLVLRKEPKILDFSFRRNYNKRLLKLALMLEIQGSTLTRYRYNGM